jgi:hypothetical protein
MMLHMQKAAKDEADNRAVNQMALIQTMSEKGSSEKTEAKDLTKAQSALSHPLSYLTGDCPSQKKDRDTGKRANIKLY